MISSVHTNLASLIALQNLGETNREMANVQNRVSTGFKVSGAKDNASVFAVAQNMRAENAALSVVRTSLDRASSIANVAVVAAETISNLLIDLREKATAALDPSIGDEARAAYEADFRSLLDQIAGIISDAEFDGANLLDNSLSDGIDFLADADGTDTLKLESENFTLGGSIITISTGNTLQSAYQVDVDGNLVTDAAGDPIVASTAEESSRISLDLITESLSNVNTALARLGSAATQIDNHGIFVSKLQDQLVSGVGNLVDADLAKESASLQALQVKQQLGIQSLSIANGAPQAILSLFQ